MRVKSNKTWACHSDETKPCTGAIQLLKELGKPYKVVDDSFVTLNDDWSLYV